VNDDATAPLSAAASAVERRRWRDDARMLRDHDLGLLVVSRLVSDFGNGVAPIALAFGVLALPGGDASSLGLVLLCAALPRIVFMLFGGVLADRVRRRARLMAASEIAAAAAQAVAAVLFLSGRATVPTLAALAVINGLAVAVFYPTMTGLLPQLASGAALQSANALVRLSSNLAGILGIAVGGVLVATVGAGWALLIDALSYAFSALLLWLVRAQTTPMLDGERSSVIDDLVHGWREFTARRWVWLLVVLFSLSNFGFTAAIGVLGPVRSLESWDGARGWAVVLVAFSLGTVVGVVVAMRIRPSRPRPRSSSRCRSWRWRRRCRWSSSPSSRSSRACASTSSRCSGRRRCSSRSRPSPCRGWPPTTGSARWR
jgi:MFS family permease